MNASCYLPFAGRLMIGLPFAMSGIGKLAAIGPTTEATRAAGLPFFGTIAAAEECARSRPLAATDMVGRNGRFLDTTRSPRHFTEKSAVNSRNTSVKEAGLARLSRGSSRDFPWPGQ